MNFLKNAALFIGVFIIQSLVQHAQAASLGNVTHFQHDGKGGYTIKTVEGNQARVIFLKEDVFRIWVAPQGRFTDPANSNPDRSQIVIKTDYVAPPTSYSDAGAYYEIAAGKMLLRVNKTPLTFELYSADGKVQIFREAAPIDLATASKQTLISQQSQRFYGGGQQHSSFLHNGKTLQISNGGWDEGGHANPAPFLMSSQGFGVLRNTFAPGQYDLSRNEQVTLKHDENRFDAYYFYGPDFKKIVALYTELTGRPTFLPMWALELGDADCYNRAPGSTIDVVAKIAKKYRDYDMPGGWILPNDGYGCGYTDLGNVVTKLKDLGFYTGLWTQQGVDQIATEVGQHGTRAQKLDVAWTGPGYQFSLDANKAAWEGIYNNSDSRPFVWTVRGWAGTQRYAVAWTGDQYGSWDLIRYHIPTLIGSGLSGQAYATTDIDGIWGGSAETYTRDLQWKTFTPVLYAMNGWSDLPKSPWAYDEPYRSINRDYLKRKMRLTPYMYKYMKDASETGEPIVRGMMWDHPNDPKTWGDEYQYQYMLGDSFLVAPVFNSMTLNNGVRTQDIYVPAGRYIDYWDGRYVDGNSVIKNYPITLAKLPVLVKAGAIIPMYPAMLYNNQKPKNPLTLDIYPYGNSSFTMYEDDGVTRKYTTGESATQLFSASAGTTTAADIRVDIGPSVGDFAGKLANRVYELEIHYPVKPLQVKTATTVLTEYSSAAALKSAAAGWYFDPNDRRGMIFVKLASQSTSQSAQVLVDIDESKPLPAAEPYPAPADTDQLSKLAFTVTTPSAAGGSNTLQNAFDGSLNTIWHTSWSDSAVKYPHEVLIDLGAVYPIEKFSYTPRQDGGINGTIAQYKLYASTQRTVFGEPVSSGTWANNTAVKTVQFATTSARYVKLVAESEVNGNAWASAAEFDVYKAVVADPSKKRFVKFVALSSHSNNPWSSLAELDLIANGQVISQAGWTLKSVNSEQASTGNAATKAFDGNAATFWHSQWSPQVSQHPHEMVIDLGSAQTLTGFRYLPRQDGGSNGRIAQYELYLSANGVDWGDAVASGTLDNTNVVQQVMFQTKTAQPAMVTYPAPQSVLESNTVTFEWSNDGLAQNYQLMVGTTPKGNDLYFSGLLAPSARSVSVTNLPTDGSVLYVSIHTKINGSWSSINYEYKAAQLDAAAKFRFVKLVATSEVNGGPWTSIAELKVLAGGQPIAPSNWQLAAVDSEEPGYEASKAFDNDPATFWHTRWSNLPASAPLPHEIQLDLGAPYAISGFRYLPRQSGNVTAGGRNGDIKGYQFYLSQDGVNWGSAVASGTFQTGSTEQQVNLP
jgi:alpha-glucosidase